MSKYDLWLYEIPGIGSRTVLRILDVMGGEPDFARTLYEMPQQDRKMVVDQALSQERGLRPERVVRALNHSAGPDPDQCAELLDQKGIRFRTILEEDYPQRLRNIADPPFGLYCLGKFPSGSRPSVGIVGTRLASPYGRDQARIYSRTLAAGGIQIVSGMARGIDGIAGRGALDADGESYAVLGCGVDICYPPENQDLYGALCERGGVISEYPPGTRPEARLFPARNRIISGLSDVLLVIEAREQSGTLITVDRALENGRDVFALPGRVTDRNSAGCNRLIRQGAGIATSPRDILDAIYGESVVGEPVRTQKGEIPGQLSFDFEVFGNEELRPREDALIEAGPDGGTDRTCGSYPESVAALDRTARQDEAESSPVRGMNPVQQAVYEALDESEAISIDELMPAVGRILRRRVSYQEILRTLTLLSMKGLSKEVRVGYYICYRSQPVSEGS